MKVKDGAIDWGYGYVINFHRKERTKKKFEEANDSVFYVADIMVHVKKERVNDRFEPENYANEG